MRNNRSDQAGNHVDFDDYAESYDEILQAAVALSGETTDYFVDVKVRLLADIIRKGGQVGALRFLDYGCGTGRFSDHLLRNFPDAQYVGLDPSPKSIALAQSRPPSGSVSFGPTKDLGRYPPEHFTHAICAVVLHHIPVGERTCVLRGIFESLRPGGALFIFEHNPINPITRRVVDNCPFDADAVLLRASECKRLLSDTGFDRICVRYYLFLPRLLSFLRPIEHALSWNPLGAQYLAVGLKPYHPNGGPPPTSICTLP